MCTDLPLISSITFHVVPMPANLPRSGQFCSASCHSSARRWARLGSLPWSMRRSLLHRPSSTGIFTSGFCFCAVSCGCHWRHRQRLHRRPGPPTPRHCLQVPRVGGFRRPEDCWFARQGSVAGSGSRRGRRGRSSVPCRARAGGCARGTSPGAAAAAASMESTLLSRSRAIVASGGGGGSRPWRGKKMEVTNTQHTRGLRYRISRFYFTVYSLTATVHKQLSLRILLRKALLSSSYVHMCFDVAPLEEGTLPEFSRPQRFRLRITRNRSHAHALRDAGHHFLILW